MVFVFEAIIVKSSGFAGDVQYSTSKFQFPNAKGRAIFSAGLTCSIESEVTIAVVVLEYGTLATSPVELAYEKPRTENGEGSLRHVDCWGRRVFDCCGKKGNSNTLVSC